MSYQPPAAPAPQVPPVILTAQDEMYAVAGRLRDWLAGSAYPIWAGQGVDWRQGGFFEQIDQAGVPTHGVRRARVTPRQMHAFACAATLGWKQDAAPLIGHGLDFIGGRLLRPDGLYRSVVDLLGGPGDSRAVLYDQAFILLGLAAATRVLGPRPDIRAAAVALRQRLVALMRHSERGFVSCLENPLPLLSNPHMHLLEAALAWRELEDEPGWAELADGVGTLALSRMVDPVSGWIRENFGPRWTPLPGLAGHLVEPGHQFEWAWLLLRWRPLDAAVQGAARRLIDTTLAHGVHGGVAIDALLDDGAPHHIGARLWPQTERLRAVARAAEIWGVDTYGAEVVAAARALDGYFGTPIPGLWFDRRAPDGSFEAGAAPAGNLYHIVSAVSELVRIFGR